THLGGLPANGLGATDIGTRGATGGLFLDFIRRNATYYRETYGPESPQMQAASDGYHFEPSVAEATLTAMLAEQPGISVRTRWQFDPEPEQVQKEGGQLQAIRLHHRDSAKTAWFAGQVFIDATYEGDLAGAAGAPFRTRREGRDEYDEPFAGRVYKYWNGPAGPHSTFEGDDAIQAFNYRLCLTTDTRNQVPIPKPTTYHRDEYLSLVEDVLTGQHTGLEMQAVDSSTLAANRVRALAGEPARVPGTPMGMWRLTNMVALPNGKTDANNQHLAFISTDLPEENWPWPTASWAWRDSFARRLQDYTLGLLWFAQHDTALPAWFREQTLRYGFAADEYTDNGHFPRQVYVREGRRVEGDYFFTAADALPVEPGGRPPLHASSVTASHYSIDSHAMRKREPGRVHLDGFINYRTEPYTVPYGVILPQGLDNLLTPVPVSASHLGYGTLRMEPCWMALGEAAGTAAAIALNRDESPRDIPVSSLQSSLLEHGAVLIYFRDVGPEHPHFSALQYWALKGLVTEWEARLDERVKPETMEAWGAQVGLELPEAAAAMTRGELLSWMRSQDAEVE
ncbi:MAG: FAD-dependent oxidoreductase, partial [Bacteroidetes bacterium]